MTPLFRVLLTAAGLAAPVSLLAQSASISGTVFEDINYGGGAGRSLIEANTTRPGSAAPVAAAATVELYDSNNIIVARTTTSTTTGQYTFSGLAAGTYTVRVVNNTVRSNRATATAGLVSVQTFVVRNGNPDVNRVGGEAPELADGAANSGTGTLIEIRGTNPLGGDNTAFVDLVQVLTGNTGTTAVAGALLNPSFETPTQNGGFTYYNGTEPLWRFSGAAISANGSGFNSTAPAGGGSQVAAIQSTSQIQQRVALTSGTYRIQFQTSQRPSAGGINPATQTLEVFVNGASVGSITPTRNSSTYQTFTSSAFTVSAAQSAVPLASLNAQSLAPVTVTGTTVATGVDFGFNFSTIVNTTNNGQGSLDQFITNTNTLGGSSTLNQQGLQAERNTSVFMIADGAAHPGLRAGLTNQLTGPANERRALLALTADLPGITNPGTNLDGTTQTANIGNTNTLQLGTGGTVGIGNLALSKVNGPEVELSLLASGGGNNAMALSINADNCTLRGLAIHGRANAVSFGGLNALIESNLIGTTAVLLATPLTAPSTNLGVRLLSPTGLMQNNIVGYNGNSGVNYSAGAGTAGFTFRNNEFVQNGQVSAGGDALTFGDQGVAGPVLIEGNLISLSNSSGIQFEIGSVSNNIVRNNTLFRNGRGGLSTSRLEGSAIHYLARSASVNSTNTDLIERNIITENQSSGIVINYGQRNVRISRNSIFLNGVESVAGSAGLLSIDFTSADAFVGGNANYGRGDGVTPNDGLLDVAGTPATQVPPRRQGNGGIDYPIITSISRNAAGQLRVVGYVGSVPGQTRFGGAIVEVFSANNSDTNQNGPTTTAPGSPVVAHGEAQSYVGTLTADANGRFDVTFTNIVATINSGDIVTATAYLPDYGTSECGVNLVSSFQVLPVQLTGFAATAQGPRVQLRWATAMELNNNRFEIERSTDARRFERVGTVAGQGSSNLGHTYVYSDTPPTAGVLYYRLRQVDTDGTDTYSEVRTVQLQSTAGAVSIRPNPAATGRVEADLTQVPAGTYQLVVRNVRGQVVHSATTTAGTIYPLNLRQEPAGIYILTLTGAGQNFTERIVKTE